MQVLWQIKDLEGLSMNGLFKVASKHLKRIYVRALTRPCNFCQVSFVLLNHELLNALTETSEVCTKLFKYKSIIGSHLIIS